MVNAGIETTGSVLKLTLDTTLRARNDGSPHREIVLRVLTRKINDLQNQDFRQNSLALFTRFRFCFQVRSYSQECFLAVHVQQNEPDDSNRCRSPDEFPCVRTGVADQSLHEHITDQTKIE